MNAYQMLTKISFALAVCSLGNRHLLAQAMPSDCPSFVAYAQAVAKPIQGDIGQYIRLTQPYAPLDLDVRNSSVEDASRFKNYYFGVITSMAGFEQHVAMERAIGFHCGPDCAHARVDDFVSDLPQIRSLVAEFEKLPASVTLLAQWDIAGDLRVNDTFVVSGKVTAYAPTVPSGFVPSSNAKVFSSLEESLRPLKLAPATVTDMVQVMAKLHLAALQRSPQGVRVIRSGLADNHSALLLLKPDAKPPHQGEDLGNGLQVNGGTKIDESTYYYETS